MERVIKVGARRPDLMGTGEEPFLINLIEYGCSVGDVIILTDGEFTRRLRLVEMRDDIWAGWMAQQVKEGE